MSENTYTDSAKTDAVMKLLNSKKYSKLVYSIRGNPRTTFLFNPLDDERVTDIYLQQPEELPLIIKKSLVDLLATGDQQLESSIYNNLKIVISDVQQIKLHDWTADYEGIPVSAMCQVVSAYKEETYNKEGECYCPSCDSREHFRLIPPSCQNEDCKKKGTQMLIDQHKLKTGDTRIIIVQEPIDEAKFGNPRTVEVILRDEAVHDTHIGQRKKITGVFRSQLQKGKTTNRFYIHAISVEDAEETKLILPNDEQKAKFTSMSKQPDYMDILMKSFAPHIWGESLAKLCLILARVSGGTIEEHEKDIIDALLIGNPATGKSELLKFVVKVTQRAGFASGGTSSGSGVTVTMTTMPNREKHPRAGIVPNCSGSLVALDEIAQFEPEDLEKLFEAMSGRRIHYNKGGFDLDLIAETTITAGANPKGYLYDTRFGMTDNINLPAPLVSRFSLIVNMQPKRTRIEEQEISEHIERIDEIGIDEYIRQENLLTAEQLLMLFNYAKTKFNPKLEPAANALIKDFYLTMFDLQANDEQVDGAKPIDRRFQIAIRRIAKAYARLMLSDTVTKEYAMEAIEIVKKTLHSFGVNTDKGTMQLNVSGVQDIDAAFLFTIRTMEKEQDKQYLPEDEIIERLVQEHPKFFSTKKKASDYFDAQVKRARFEKSEGRYRLVG